MVRMRGAALVMAVFFFMAAAAQAAGFKREYKMQVTVGPKFYWGMGAAKFAELVKEKTKGQIKIKPYFGSALLKGAQLKSSQMVAKGVIDCALGSTINISPVIPAANVFHLPFFLNNFENLDKVKNGEAGKAIFKAMEAKRLQPLAWAENGFRQLTNSKILVKTPADMKGLRVRVVGNPMFIDTFKALGADPVNMN
ncbi:MAG: TRAP transporter substrate-binding protein DctP, partial [Desulfovibrionales bacterium]|nr:TRAP transporter substrate-binding protein DctP [Desulfovibrionales bacterium]